MSRAIIYVDYSGDVLGHHPDPTEEQINEAIGTDIAIVVDKLPPDIANTPPDKRVKVISRSPLVLILEDRPIPPEPPKTPEQLRLEALEVENADVWYELMLKESRIAEHDTEIADIWYEIMTTGGTGA